MTSNVQPSVDCEMATKYELMHGKPCLNPIYCNMTGCSEEERDGCFTFKYILAFVYVSVLVCVPVSLFRSASMG